MQSPGFASSALLLLVRVYFAVPFEIVSVVEHAQFALQVATSTKNVKQASGASSSCVQSPGSASSALLLSARVHFAAPFEIGMAEISTFFACV